MHRIFGKEQPEIAPEKVTPFAKKVTPFQKGVTKGVTAQSLVVTGVAHSGNTYNTYFYNILYIEKSAGVIALYI